MDVVDVVQYLGNVDPKTRDVVRKEFLEVRGPKILIAGLKCGGQALNLTVSNRVILIDLWWNHSVELQAFGRVFR